jgi:hypothetical protein
MYANSKPKQKLKKRNLSNSVSKEGVKDGY